MPRTLVAWVLRSRTTERKRSLRFLKQRGVHLTNPSTRCSRCCGEGMTTGAIASASDAPGDGPAPRLGASRRLEAPDREQWGGCYASRSPPGRRASFLNAEGPRPIDGAGWIGHAADDRVARGEHHEQASRRAHTPGHCAARARTAGAGRRARCDADRRLCRGCTGCAACPRWQGAHRRGSRAPRQLIADLAARRRAYKRRLRRARADGVGRGLDPVMEAEPGAIAEMWFLTVLRLMYSSLPISAFSLPSARRRTTSRSRSVERRQSVVLPPGPAGAHALESTAATLARPEHPPRRPARSRPPRSGRPQQVATGAREAPRRSSRSARQRRST